jgi:hypothetical protein
MAARLGLARLIQDNLRLIRQRQKLSDDEPFVTLQARGAAPGAPGLYWLGQLDRMDHSLMCLRASRRAQKVAMRVANRKSPGRRQRQRSGFVNRPPGTRRPDARRTPLPARASQVGKRVFEGAPRQMRVELWKSSLQRRGVGVAAAKSFEHLLEVEVSLRCGPFWCRGQGADQLLCGRKGT